MNIEANPGYLAKVTLPSSDKAARYQWPDKGWSGKSEEDVEFGEGFVVFSFVCLCVTWLIVGIFCLVI